MMDAEDWVLVCAEDELPAGEFRVIDVDGADVAVFNIDGELMAIEDVCTHDGAPLTGGPVEGRQIICPRHGARFCLRTGNALTPPAYEPTSVMPVRVDDGKIFVRDDRWD